MEMNNLIEKQDLENLKLGVHELAEEVKELNKTQANIVDTVNHLSGKVSKFGESLAKINTEPPAFNVSRVEDTLKKGLHDISEMVSEKIKNSSRKFQILLFPPQEARLFYKIVFGRWFLYAIIGLAILKIYEWSIHESNNRTSVKMEEAKIEAQILKNSWFYLYTHSNKNFRKQMDSALYKSVR